MLPLRWFPTPKKQRIVKPQTPRAHSQVRCAAERHLNACRVHHVTACQGAGHRLGSSAAVSAAFVPTATAKVPEVDVSQTTAQVRCHPTLSLPALQSLSQVAVTLFNGKRERLTLNQSFTGALLLPFCLSSNAASLVVFASHHRVLSSAVGDLYACVSGFTPGISFTLSAGVPPQPLNDLSATLASAALLNTMVRQCRS